MLVVCGGMLSLSGGAKDKAPEGNKDKVAAKTPEDTKTTPKKDEDKKDTDKKDEDKKPPIVTPQQPKEERLPPPLVEREVQDYAPMDLWRKGLKAAGERVRVRGVAKVSPAGDRLLVRFDGPKGALVSCSVPMNRAGPLAGKLTDVESREITVEGDVSNEQAASIVLVDASVLRAGEPLK
jgi:hypothetical protein